MIEWLRSLSPPLRYLMYVAGTLLVLFVAIGVGVTAAVVVGWQFGRVATDSAGTSTLEGSKSEMTSSARASDNTAIESSSDSKDPKDTADKASFIHRATDENSRGDYTYIADPAIKGSPNAIVLISVQKDIGSTSYNHNIGVRTRAEPKGGRSSTRIEQWCPQEPPSGWRFRKHPRSSSTTQVL